nr:integrase, catalytic region, zinc finger, CCHC-type, peptidase aspartic, catalytic [Tanacetum cinerariifolium]
MWESAKTVAPTPNSTIIQLDVDDNFVINSTHLNMIRESKFDGYLWADPHDHIREFLTICNMFKYDETQSKAVKLLIFPFSLCDEAKTWFNELNEESITSREQMRKAFINKFFPPSLFNRLLLEIRNYSQLAMDSQIISLNEELQDIRNKYNELREGNASKNHMNDGTSMCERHEVNYVQSEGHQNRISHDLYSHQSHHDPNDSEKSLTELNNDVRNYLEDFTRRIRSMRTVHWKLFARDDGKTTGVLPKKMSKTVNQEPQSKTDHEKSITQFLDGQRVTSMFFKNNVSDMILKMKKNEKNFQTKIKNMERKIDEWEKSKKISLEQTNRTEPPPPPQAHTEHVNAVFIESEKFDDSPKIKKDPPPPIIVNNKIKKDKLIKTSKKGYHVVKTKEYPFPGSESRPPLLNKENYVPWPSRLLHYAKSRPNGKLIHNSIINGPYVRRMIPEPGDTNREVPEKKAKLFNEWERFTSNEGESIESYYHRFLKLMNDLKRNKHFSEKIASNLKILNNLQPEWSRHVAIVHQTKDLHTADYTQLYDFLKYNQKETSDPTTAMNMALALMAKAFKLNYSTPTNNNQRISSNLRNRQIAQPGMNMGQDRQMQMVGDNGENQFRQYAGQNVGSLNGYNAVQNVGNQVAQNPRVQNVGNLSGLIGVPGNANLNGNGNLVAARVEGNAARHNGNQIRCYNCREVGHFARNCTQASTSGTHTDKALVYDSDGSAEVHDNENYDDNEIFNMFTQEEQYTEILEPILKPHQVPHNNNNVISEDTSVEQSEETVEQHPANFKETRALYDSFYQNLAIEVDKVNSEAAKFVGDFKSLAKEADESLAKHKALELEIERILRAVVSQDILSVVQKESVVDTSNLQTELERTKERFETCIIKKENEYAKIWNDWYKKCDECKYDKISYDKAYKDMQQKIERLQAQLGDLKGKSRDTSCVSDTLNHLSQKLESENLRAQLFNKISDQMDNKRGMSANTKFAKQSIVKNLPKVDEIHALSKPVTLNSVLTPQESKVVKNDKVIAPGMFRINPSKTSREEKHVPNNVRASARIKPITVSQPHVITKKDVNSDSNGLSFSGIDNTKTRRTQPRSNTKNDRVPSASKSSQSKNKRAEVEEHHRNLLFSKNTKHIYVNDKSSHGKKQKANVSTKEKQKKHQQKVKKSKKVGFIERLATPKPRKSIFLLRWSPTGRLFDQKGKIVDSSKSESQSDCSNGDNACTSNTLEPKIKRFPNSTSLLSRNDYVAAILGFGDLQWGNILITRVYFVEGLEAARTMLIFSRAPLFLWAEAIATACFTQNRSIIHRRFNKTPYKLINGRKPDISFLHVFGALCYPKNDREDIGKLGAK